MPTHTCALDAAIAAREAQLRAWFTRGCDPIMEVVDGLDIGWGGVGRWATAHMPPPGGLHLDVACGYGTFLAQMGWRFPTARLVGLNIDFAGPHALARPLLAEARVRAGLVQADARRMPFADGALGSASCFLGLQDVEIGFGEEGLRQAVAEGLRVLRPGGVLTLLDEFPFERFDSLLEGLPARVTDRRQRPLPSAGIVRWQSEPSPSMPRGGWLRRGSPAGRSRTGCAARCLTAWPLTCESNSGHRDTMSPSGRCAWSSPERPAHPFVWAEP
jgi:SAM-dependent methyltransferase